MKIRWLAIVVAVLLPICAAAAVRCDFQTVLTAPAYSYAGVLTLERDRSRVDFTSGDHPLFNPNMSVITRDGGRNIVLLDHARKTWHQRSSREMGGHLSTTRGIGMTAKASKPAFETDSGASAHRLHARYSIVMTVEGESLPATIELEALSEGWTAVRQEALPWGFHFGAKTGFEEIDRLISRRLPSRLPSRQVITASRQIEGGPKVTETITTTVTNVRQTVVDWRVFFPPSGYRYEAPKFQFGE